MSSIERLETKDVFAGYKFAQSDGRHYEVPAGWYPLLGLPGSLNIEENAVLFCQLQAPVAANVRKLCFNGVIEKIRIHRSARVKGPDSMLVLASDLLHEFEVCQIPMMSDAEAKTLTNTIPDQPGPRESLPDDEEPYPGGQGEKIMCLTPWLKRSYDRERLRKGIGAQSPADTSKDKSE